MVKKDVEKTNTAKKVTTKKTVATKTAPQKRETVVLIDSSYFNFYRFYATRSWYNRFPELRELAKGLPWINNSTFMKTFEKKWFDTIRDLCKKFSVKESDLIFARDGNNVWRYEIFPEYKANRAVPEEDDPDTPKLVFKHINENYHSRLKGSTVLRVDSAEADDIIAVAVKYLKSNSPETHIIVITGDHDILQLSDKGSVDIYQLKGWKDITAENPRQVLMTKILAGDPSDNIPNAFEGCGKKTAQKLANNPEQLEKLLNKHGHKQYDLNCKLVDFDNIPENVTDEIISLLPF